MVLAHWGECNHPELPRLMGRGQRRVHCSAQNSLLAPETPTCSCSGQVPHLRVYLERLLRQLSCASPCTPHPQSPGPPELANTATRVTCPPYLASSCRPTSLAHQPSRHGDIQALGSRWETGLLCPSLTEFLCPQGFAEASLSRCPRMASSTSWGPDIWGYQLCLFIIYPFPRNCLMCMQ